MMRKQVVTKRVVSPDGRVIAEATSISVVSSSSDHGATPDTEAQTESMTPTVTATVSSSSSHSSSSSSSFCSR